MYKMYEIRKCTNGAFRYRIEKRFCIPGTIKKGKIYGTCFMIFLKESQSSEKPKNMRKNLKCHLVKKGFFKKIAVPKINGDPSV